VYLPCIRSGTRYKMSALADLRWPGVPADGPGWGAATAPHGTRSGAPEDADPAMNSTVLPKRLVLAGDPSRVGARKRATDEDNSG